MPNFCSAVCQLRRYFANTPTLRFFQTRLRGIDIDLRQWEDKVLAHPDNVPWYKKSVSCILAVIKKPRVLLMPAAVIADSHRPSEYNSSPLVIYTLLGPSAYDQHLDAKFDFVSHVWSREPSLL